VTANDPATAGASVVIAEDDRSQREALDRALRLAGYRVRLANDGVEALGAVVDERPDVLVLDVMMPRMDGLAVCRAIRAQGDRLPILVLTARGAVDDRVDGLDAGADDYLAKPYALNELLARLRALLRRTAPAEGEGQLTVADLTLDPARRVATRGDRELGLTKTEFDLLELLIRNAGIVLTRDRIYERIWGFDFETSSKTLDVYVGYLRRKTEEGGEPRLVHTVRGVGYVLRAS
jgi:two-component system, OmpR family, response regulator MprA